MCIAVEEDI